LASRSPRKCEQLMNPKVLFLAGPTGSGKSELAIQLAKSLNGEIISCDAMQVYRGMNIGTAKLSRLEQRKIKHYLNDVVNPRQQFSVKQYRDLALEVIQKIHRKKKIPIVAGGSGLYMQSLIDGLAPQSGKTVRIRRELERAVRTDGLEFYYEKLKQIDPKRADEILPGDQRRILRALEIYEAFGVKPSDWRATRVSLNEIGYSWKLFGIRRDRSELYNRINERVRRMIKRGFIREVKRLRKAGLSRTARQAIGYYEILQFLKNQISLEDAIQITQKRTRHLAKKQLIWFRKEKRMEWIDIKGENFTRAKEKMIQRWQRK